MYLDRVFEISNSIDQEVPSSTTEVIIPEINKHKKEVLEKAKKNTQKAKEKLENKINLE